MTTAVFETKNGTVSGRDLGTVTRVTRLRYAKAPTGARRFAIPQPVDPWQGTLDCTAASSPLPPQLGSRLAKVMGTYPAEQDEDCLHLDIWIPNQAATPLPVLVFLHGGAFMSGGGGMSCYDGATLAERENIIVVNITYRLGVLGFLPIAGLAPANLGLRDQELALRFIRSCIADFGGDAGNITVSGQSAGAYSIQALLTRDTAPELFDRAIVMSSPMGLIAQDLDSRVGIATDFLNALGLDDPAELRALPVAQLLEAQGTVLRGLGKAPDDVAPPFLPLRDDDFLTADPAATETAQIATWCPILTGVTREEHAAFHYQDTAFLEQAPALLPIRFAERYGAEAETELARARASRVPPSDAAVLIDHGSRWRFVFGTFDYIEARAAAGSKIWAYVFGWQSPNPEIAACHCIELPFVFGNLPDWTGAPMLEGARAEELHGMAQVFGGALAAFARSGDPQAGTALTWPEFGTERAYLTFDNRVTSANLPQGGYPC